MRISSAAMVGGFVPVATVGILVGVIVALFETCGAQLIKAVRMEDLKGQNYNTIASSVFFFNSDSR